MSKPIAVLISDIHYSLSTLELADKSMRLAIEKANSLDVPLIVAGDLHDTKANLRGECVTAMRQTFKTANWPPYVLRGNHDAINEKSKEHSLSAIEDLASIIIEASCYNIQHPKDFVGRYLCPYYHDADELRAYLKTVPKGSTLIMHQGLIDSNAGHYMQDKSAITKDDVADFRVISGHYHTRQTIKTGRPRQGAVGLWDYIGNPYTLNYGEANDPPKGFQILYDDGSLEFVPTNLRKHVVVELEWSKTPIKPLGIKPDDLVWIKISGTREQLAGVNKENTASEFKYRGNELPENFKLDLTPLESETSKPTQVNQPQPEILDGLIDSLTNTSDAQKTRVKNLWRNL